MPQPAGSRRPARRREILRTELRRLATHIGAWDRELRANKAQLRQLVTQIMPALPGQPGVGPMSAAQLLVSRVPSRPVPLRGRLLRPGRVSPPEASSGKITRHRLNPFGDRSSTAPCTSSSTGGCSPQPNPGLPRPPGRTQNRTRTPPLPQALRSPQPLPPHGDSRQDLTAHRAFLGVPAGTEGPPPRSHCVAGHPGLARLCQTGGAGPLTGSPGGGAAKARGTSRQQAVYVTAPARCLSPPKPCKRVSS